MDTGAARQWAGLGAPVPFANGTGPHDLLRALPRFCSEVFCPHLCLATQVSLPAFRVNIGGGAVGQGLDPVTSGLLGCRPSPDRAMAPVLWTAMASGVSLSEGGGDAKGGYEHGFRADSPAQSKTLLQHLRGGVMAPEPPTGHRCIWNPARALAPRKSLCVWVPGSHIPWDVTTIPSR